MTLIAKLALNDNGMTPERHDSGSNAPALEPVLALSNYPGLAIAFPDLVKDNPHRSPPFIMREWGRYANGKRYISNLCFYAFS